MPWKEELPNQGPAPSSSAQSRPGFSEVEDRLARALKTIEAGAGKVNVTGSIDVSLAPIARFPWEVRVVGENIRVYKGMVVNAQSTSDVRRSHIKVSGKSKNPVRINDSRAGSPGDFDWSPPPNQRDPYSVPPPGPGTQVAWPPFYVDGAFATVGTNKRDPEPKDGGIPFSTFGSYVGKNGYDSNGADENPWFEFPYATGPIFLAGRTSAFGSQEVGVFQDESAIDASGWKVMIAYVSSPELIHQFFRSDLVLVGGSGAGETDHPFKVHASVDGENVKLTITDGFVNNWTLDNPGAEITISGVGIYKVYLVVSKTGVYYPSGVTWAVTPEGSNVPANDDDTAHVLIAVVNVAVVDEVTTPTITQMVSTALNSIRVKYAPAAGAVYYLFNRV